MALQYEIEIRLPVIRNQVLLAPFTTMGVGGSARYFTQVEQLGELIAVLEYAQQHQLPYYLLGGGSNVLINDRGFDGLVIQMELDSVAIDGNRLSAGAGTVLADVIEKAAEKRITGLEHLAGIPGTFGGAVRGNAGAYGVALGDIVTEVTVLEAKTLELKTYDRTKCDFKYRDSVFKQNPGLIVVSAAVELAAGDPQEIRETMTKILKRRECLETAKSVGSYFMNPIPDDPVIIEKFETDCNVVCRNCMIPAGWFIEKSGLRGTRVGGAMVSEKHCNYLINTGTATAEDLRGLARVVKETVREKMGVELQEEVNYVGF
ncbi:UDP-N-acetylmuramate dehydrogenase [Pelotalea chapellei]|uniref:UDP-N-acetylenolpyruvoylglucosamine reductase n=1 Tax=Pelotalea chapellei TaxID=44671 RepID=A0ABS5U977_9BACT|nr:UDP-N-acetylmuramate dehydrogenase [Pelotalea chapellei]MBT1072242.1 UDP-N-acetylmuramate dehydrogenase [Pelotalea chapellei]